MTYQKVVTNARAAATHAAGMAARGHSPPALEDAARRIGVIWKTLTVPEHMSGLLARDGVITGVLEPGRHVWADWSNRTAAALFDMRVARIATEWGPVLERNHAVREADIVRTVRPAVGELALVRVGGQPETVIPGGQTAFFWTALRPVEVETVRVEDAVGRADRRMLDAWAPIAGQALAAATVGHAEAGLVFVDGALVERIAPGRHAYWTFDRTVRIATLDLRPQVVEVTAQEILTKDRVSVRLTLAATVRVRDPEAVVQAVDDHETHIYRLTQLATREAVGGRTLDELLKDRVAVDREVAEGVRTRLGDAGLEVIEARIKDVILPGEMRALMNRVVEAEKAAQANLIRRREETAATRNLLNTARLMDDNPTLMRLKELEALERVTEKIGRIDVHTGREGLEAVLTDLVRLNGPAKADA